MKEEVNVLSNFIMFMVKVYCDVFLVVYYELVMWKECVYYILNDEFYS